MADNVNPQAVSFSNSKARVFADSLLSAIQTARAFKAFYDANALDSIFPADAEKIADGSDLDAETAGDHMTADPVSVARDMPLEEACDLMISRNVRHLLVDEGGALVGVHARQPVGQGGGAGAAGVGVQIAPAL